MPLSVQAEDELASPNMVIGASIQALSPCPTFRPEHADWKHQVHAFENEEVTDDPLDAVQRIMADDGLSTGIIYQRDLPSIQPGGKEPSAELEAFENEFEI